MSRVRLTAKAQGKLAVGLVLAIRDIAQRRPDAALKIGADVDWQLDVKLSRLANKVGHELGDDLLALWMGRQEATYGDAALLWVVGADNAMLITSVDAVRVLLTSS